MKLAVVFFSLFMSYVLTMNIINLQENVVEKDIESKKREDTSVNNLKVSNFTGSGITSDMVSTFIKFINDIYEF